MSHSELLNDAADADLLTRVGIALTLRLQHTLHAVHVQVNRGTVTLRGIVPTFYDRQLAIEVTRRVAGVLKVHDELAVAGQKSQPVARPTDRAKSSDRHHAFHRAGTVSAESASDERGHQTKTVFNWRTFLAKGVTVVRSLFLLVALMFVVGCGRSAPDSVVAVHPAKGKITFKGQPIPGAMITLHPKAEIAEVPKPRASVGKDGEFALTTFSGKDGAPEGEYTVTVVWYKPIKNGPDIQAGPNVIPKKYTAPQTSDLHIRIAAGENELPAIQL